MLYLLIRLVHLVELEGKVFLTLNRILHGHTVLVVQLLAFALKILVLDLYIFELHQLVVLGLELGVIVRNLIFQQLILSLQLLVEKVHLALSRDLFLLQGLNLRLVLLLFLFQS